MNKKIVINSRFDRYIYLVILVILILVLSTSIIYGPNDFARFGTMKEVVEKGTFAINDTHSETVDLIFANGQYYASKPPVLTLIGAGIYSVVHNIFGYSMPVNNYQTDLSVYIINVILVGGSIFLLAVFFYKAIALYIENDRIRLLLCALLIFGTLIFSYIGTLNNHIPAAATMFGAFYFVLRQVKNGGSKKSGFLSGLLLGAAISIEPLPAAIFTGVLAIYYFNNKQIRKYILYFIVGLLPFIGLYVGLNIYILGTPLPHFLFPNNYDPPNSYWQNPYGIDALHQSKLLYAFNLLFGSHGLFIYTPMLFFLIIYTKKYISEKTKEKHLFLVISVAFSIYFAYLVIRTSNYGGSSFGPRWFISFTPLLFFFVAIKYEEIKNKKPNTLAFLVVFSIIVAIFGYWHPWGYNVLEVDGRSLYFPLMSKLFYVKDSIFSVFN